MGFREQFDDRGTAGRSVRHEDRARTMERRRLRVCGKAKKTLYRLLNEMPEFNGDDPIREAVDWFASRGWDLNEGALNHVARFVLERLSPAERQRLEELWRRTDEQLAAESRMPTHAEIQRMIRDDMRESEEDSFDEFQHFNQQPQDRLRFSDFAELKCGRDAFSGQRLPKLRDQVSAAAREEIEAAFTNPKQQAAHFDITGCRNGRSQTSRVGRDSCPWNLTSCVRQAVHSLEQRCLSARAEATSV